MVNEVLDVLVSNNVIVADITVKELIALGADLVQGFPFAVDCPVGSVFGSADRADGVIVLC